MKWESGWKQEKEEGVIEKKAGSETEGSQSSLNSKRKRGRVKIMRLKCLVLQNPAHMVHPQKMCFQAKYQIFLSIAHAFPFLSLPSYRNSSSSQEQIITSCFLFALVLNTVTTFGLMLGLVKSSLKVKHTELLTSQTYWAAYQHAFEFCICLLDFQIMAWRVRKHHITFFFL